MIDDRNEADGFESRTELLAEIILFVYIAL
jgi:hypothetical protein